MYEPKGDPFFEQLKQDIADGIKALDEGRVISGQEVREHFRKRVAQVSQESEEPPQ
jgi:hypothetical protein